MSQEQVKKKRVLLFFTWVFYIALLSVYGEFILSRPVNGWLQYFASALLLLISFYLFKFTLGPLISSNKQQDDNN